MIAIRRLLLVTQWTDFDAGAERAAIALARRLRLPLAIVVPLLSNPEYEVVAHELVAGAEASAAKAIAGFTARAQSAGVSIDIRVRRGDELWREVTEEARAMQADLIAIRRRGHRSFLGKLRVGEMVRQIAAHAHCPLMMVPRMAAAPSKGLLAVIEADSAIDPEMRAACTLAGALGLPLGVAIVLAEGQPPERGVALLRRAQAAAGQAGLKVGGSVRSGRLADAVDEGLRASGADLLVVSNPPGPGGHGKLGATVETVVSQAPCATLLVGSGAAAAG